MPRRLALIASSLALAVVLVGCGSDDDSSDGDTTTTTAADESSTTTTETGEDDPDTSETTAPDDTAETTAPVDDASTTTVAEGGGEPGEPAFCSAYATFEESFNDLPDDTLEQVRAGFTALDEALSGLQQIAPAELAEDLDVLAQAAADLVAEAADDTTVEEATTTLTEVFGGEQFTAAAERVDGYFTSRCPEANDDQADG